MDFIKNNTKKISKEEIKDEIKDKEEFLYEKKLKLKKFKYLTMSGCGIYGFCFIGALKYFEENGVEFKEIIGVSSGAMIGLLVTLGYKYEELKKVYSELDFNKFLDINIDNFFKNYGIDKCNRFIKIYASFFKT